MGSIRNSSDKNGQTNPETRKDKAPFNPLDLGLNENFLLTDYSRLKGCSCKVPQAELLQLLEKIQLDGAKAHMDCSVTPLRYQVDGQQLVLVSTTDFFFPSVDDPFLQGEIGCANVLSDLYSLGVTRCDNMLMLLAQSTDFTAEEGGIVLSEMMKGFVSKASSADTFVNGGQTVENPWPLIGGVAMAVYKENELVYPVKFSEGDVLVLTKPLGTQVAVNLKQWLHRPSIVFQEYIEGNISSEDIEALYAKATTSMRRLNRNAAELMKECFSHGATDITGFGLLGHASNLIISSDSSLLFASITHLPVFEEAFRASKLMHDPYKLLQGTSAETSGGLLVAFPSLLQADCYIEKLRRFDENAWIIGRVEKMVGNHPLGKRSLLAPNVEFILV